VIASLALPGAAGCAAGFALSAAPSVDTKGGLGTEERLQAFAGVGAPSFRFFGALSAGAGYLGGARSGFATVSPELGVEGGREVVWSVSALYAPRFLFTGPVSVAQGGGAAGQVLFRVQRMGGEDGSLLVGPRLSAEVVDLNPALPEGKGTVGLFQLGVVLRWTTFDTTAKSWTN
jgi:hypothetical protein